MNWGVLFLLPLSCAFGALLGGYRPVENDDPVIQSKLRPMLETKGRLGTLPIRRVEQQRLYKETNYKVYQGIPNNSGLEICVKITCFDSKACNAAEPCDKNHAHNAPIQAELKPHLLGGHEAAQPKEVQEAVDFAVEKINSMSNSMFRLVAEDVTNMTKQVINGLRYKFTITLVSTACRNALKNKGKQLGECKLTEDAERQQCHVSVLYTRTDGQKWEYSLESQQCGPLHRANRSVHSVLGGDDHDYCHVHLKAFRKFKDDFQRLYGSEEEEAARFKTFCVNMKRIKTVQEHEQGSATYGINKFADLSEAEFRKYYLTPTWDLKTLRPWMTPAGPANPNGDAIPDSFDWRDKGAVTPVKNQGQCGSCWAFSTTGNIEGQWAIKSNKLVSLSEQELVDCDKLDEGCNGGLPSNAYEAIMKLGGLETEGEYKYEGADEKCKFNRTEVAVKINGGLNISSDETEMKAWLFKNGPISIGINAFAMQFYFGGISHPWKIFCNPTSLDHGVLIVGYGVSSSGEPYWIVKNSWGPDWGEKGYYLVYRGSGVCGLNQMCTSAKIN
ncbi:cathepsin L-like [Littorina saxatilis]|uniref:Cathepsin F n=1 Tax=Littorina saxatilis TaxID=31220 RepID=A0AAN9BH07_9CAEN